MKSILLLVFLSGALGLKNYQDRMPNGFRVPHPCFAFNIWNGVGHKNHEGGGTLNPFGQDFRANGFVWDQCICEQDSDGDGKTNGEELGDPDCEWLVGEVPKHVSGLGHPGICEPLDDPVCQENNNWEPQICTPVVYDCPEIENDPDVSELPLRFSNITLEPIETSYWCQAVEFPKDGDYHMFSMQPLVDNQYIVHHIDMYECEGQSGDWALENYNTPKICGAMEGCGGNMIAAWALGITGICLGDSHGIRIGKHGAQVAMLRVHYHNPEELENQHDTSGLLMHYTSDIRPYDVQVLNLGQMYLEIPPQLPKITEEIMCGPFCTNSFKQEIKIILGTVHMHYLGKSAKTEVWRDGKFVKEIFRQDNYDYNQPVLVSFEDNPIIIQPGDELRHVCEFQSVERNEIVYRGQSAYDEMCHVYFVYYPAQNLTECFNDGPSQTCKNRYQSGRERWIPDNCDMEDFNSQYDAWMRAHLEAECDDTGNVCRPGCEEAVANITAASACMEEESIKYIKRAKGGAFRNMVNSCKVWPIAPPSGSTPVPPNPDDCIFGRDSSTPSATPDTSTASATQVSVAATMATMATAVAVLLWK